MAFYENTIIAKQDLAENEIKSIIDKYNELINGSSGKVVKIEEWGLLSLSHKIKNYKKGFYIHFKFEGNKETLEQVDTALNVGGSIKQTVYDPDDYARTTMKETTINNERDGNIDSKADYGLGYLTNKMEAPNTNKQFTHHDYKGGISTYISNQMSHEATQ